MFPFLPPCGGDAEGRGGVPVWQPYQVVTSRPLSLRDICPLAGGEEEWRLCSSLQMREGRDPGVRRTVHPLT